MEWDLGIRGLATLVALALGFGLAAFLIFGRTSTRWLWPIVSITVFVAGLLTSEAWFGWATEEDLQPNIDGLSFDEVLVAGLLSAIAAVVVTRRVAGGTRRIGSKSLEHFDERGHHA